MPTYRVVGKHIYRTSTVDTDMGPDAQGNPRIVRQPGPMAMVPVGTELTNVTEEELKAFPDRFELVEGEPIVPGGPFNPPPPSPGQERLYPPPPDTPHRRRVEAEDAEQQREREQAQAQTAATQEALRRQQEEQQQARQARRQHQPPPPPVE